MLIPNITAKRLIDLREAKDMSIAKVARETDIPESTYRLLECMDEPRDYKSYHIIKLAKYFDVSADYLLGLSENKRPDNADFLKIGLSDDAVQVLAEKKQDNTIVSRIIAHPMFSEIIHEVSCYINRYSENSFITVENTNRIMQHIVRSRFEHKVSDDTFKSGMEVLEKQRVDAAAYTKEQICGKFGEMLEDIYKADKRLSARMKKEQEENEEYLQGMLKTISDVLSMGITAKTEQDILTLIASVLRLELDDTQSIMEYWESIKNDKDST